MEAASSATVLSSVLLALAVTNYGIINVQAQPVSNENYENATAYQMLYQDERTFSKQQIDGLLQRKMVDTKYFWPRTNGNLLIYFAFGDAKVDKIKVRKALTDWEEKTCVRFQEVYSSYTGPHLRFIDAGNCQSMAGKQPKDGPHVVKASKGCSDRITNHELGHALGFEHEHCRSDRDNYITVFPQNAAENQRYNFNKLVTNQYYMPYDFYSVMHYGSWAFSEKGGVTIRTLDPMYQQLAGQGPNLSYMDALLFNIAYKCLNQWYNECPNWYCTYGFVYRDRYTGACKCRCQDGTSGTTCYYFHTTYNAAVLRKGSPYTRKIKQEGPMTSIDYPKIHAGLTSYTQFVKAPKCKRAVVTFKAFNVDPRSDGKCYLTSVEIRTNDKPTTGRIFCGTDIAPGTRIVGDTDTVILHFFSYFAGHKGYYADVTFESIPYCS